MNKKPGRKPGFVVSDESKLQARNSNPYKVRVKTALGEFLGYEDAATAHGITPSLIKHRCQKGAHQREIGKLRDIESNRGKQPFDCREYFSYTYKKIIRPVKTPHGEFLSVTAAAKFEGVTSAAICHKLKRSNTEYFYLGE